jgi:hypothetical protein
MSSTNPKGGKPVDRERLRRFYLEQLVPAAERLRKRGVTLFPLGADDAPSWYADPPSYPELTAIEPASFGEDLKLLWQSKNLPELAELAVALGSLAGELEIVAEQSEDVSPFVYVMF